MGAWRNVAMVAKFLDLNNLSWYWRSFALSKYESTVVEIEKYGYHGNMTWRLLLSIRAGSVGVEGHGRHTPIQNLREYPPPPDRNTNQKCLIIFRVSDCHSFSFDCKFPGLFTCRWCRACWFKSDRWLAAYFGLSFPWHWSPLLSLSLRWSLNPFYAFIMLFIWFRIIWVAVF